jgi:hypothetical protein
VTSSAMLSGSISYLLLATGMLRTSAERGFIVTNDSICRW